MSHRWALPLSAPGTLALLAALVAGPPAAAAKAKKKSPPDCSRCSDLTSLQRELAQQEWLRDRFQQFIDYRLPPSPKKDGNDDRDAASRMRDTVEAEFNAWLNSPAGAGGGIGQAEAGTSLVSCELVTYVKDAQGKNKKDKKGDDVTRPVTDKEIRAQYCPAIADMILTHEGQHQIDCRANKKSSEPRDLSQWQNFAAYDVRGYSAGIASLRKSIAALARKCGWKGSTSKTKKKPLPKVPTDDRKELEEDVVPTPQELEALAKTLGGGKR